MTQQFVSNASAEVYHNSLDIHIPVSTCVQHMTGTIYRALHHSIERNGEHTDNITNVNVCALHPSGTRDGGSRPWFQPDFVDIRTRNLELLE